jgi:hypothetical protein
MFAAWVTQDSKNLKRFCLVIVLRLFSTTNGGGFMKDNRSIANWKCAAPGSSAYDRRIDAQIRFSF